MDIDFKLFETEKRTAVVVNQGKTTMMQVFPEVIIEKILWKQFADEKPVIPGVYLVAWESVNMDQTCGVEQSTWSMGLNQLGFNNLTQDNVYDERGVMTYGRTIIAWSEMPTYWR